MSVLDATHPSVGKAHVFSAWHSVNDHFCQLDGGLVQRKEVHTFRSLRLDCADNCRVAVHPRNSSRSSSSSNPTTETGRQKGSDQLRAMHL